MWFVFCWGSCIRLLTIILYIFRIVTVKYIYDTFLIAYNFLTDYI